MRLPPLRANPLQGPSFKHDYTQPFYGELSERPSAREFQQPARPHPDQERREEPAAPARNVAPAPSTTGKSTK